MSSLFILLVMIFMHILDDFCLQPICLSNLKQKQFWEEKAPDRLYKNDYIMALFMHGFSWSFMVMLPLLILTENMFDSDFLTVFISNIIIHAVVDHLKANVCVINLVTDQIIHLIQLCLTIIILL